MRDNSIKSVRENAVSDLIRSGISANEARIEADILLEYVFGINKKEIIKNPDMELNADLTDRFNNLINRRIEEKVPVQYLTNTAYFMGYKFYVDENVLIPRPETEILVEEVLKHTRQHKEATIIDIGTGSGCIACSIACLANNVNIAASDISGKALEVAKINAKNLGVQDKIKFIQSDIFENIQESFDIIVSNPPYISIQERESLQIEVSAHEPHLALFVEDEKGIGFYEKLISQSKSKLRPNGFLAVEAGINQSQYITEIFKNSGFEDIKIIKDYSGIDRVIIGS